MPRYRRYFDTNDVVFVTLVTAERRRWLTSERAKQHFLDCLREVKINQPFQHFGHVILDDHVHWLFRVNENHSVSSLVASLKQRVIHSRRQTGLNWQGLWQRRFYDHIIRDERDFREHLDYIHYNPVRHGYVSMACQWKWSSFHTWVARGNYSHCWGTKEPPMPGDVGEPR